MFQVSVSLHGIFSEWRAFACIHSCTETADMKRIFLEMDRTPLRYGRNSFVGSLQRTLAQPFVKVPHFSQMNLKFYY